MTTTKERSWLMCEMVTLILARFTQNKLMGCCHFFDFDWAVPISQCSFTFIFFPHFWAEKTNQNGLFISPMIYCFFLNTYIMIVITEGKENLNFGSLNERETDYISELPKKKLLTLPVNFHFYNTVLAYFISSSFCIWLFSSDDAVKVLLKVQVVHRNPS